MTSRHRFSMAVLALGSGAVAGCQDTEPTSLTINGPPAAMTLVSGNNQIGTAGAKLPQSLVIQVSDQAGAGVPAVRVEWSATGGQLSASVDSTGNDGRSTVSWTLPAEPGLYQATATVSGLSAMAFGATATPSGQLLVFRYVDAGSYHGCGIATDEQLYCWGYNGDGQLGIPAGVSKPYPNLVPSVERFRLVSGGRYHTCGVTLSGGIVCWGQDRDNRSIKGDPISFQGVQAGLLHTCGLNMSRELWCWGYNGEGELGVPTWNLIPNVTTNGSTSAGSTTIQLQGLAPGFWLPAGTRVAIGSETLVVVRDAQANPSGQVTVQVNPATRTALIPDASATGVTVPSATPGEFIADPTHIGNSYKAMTTGGLHTCAVREDGTGWCWGFGAEGQRGTGGFPRIGSAPAQVLSPVAFRTTPTVVPPSPDPDFPLPPGPFIAAGHAHSCAIGLNDVTYCWGLNESGQLGDGTTTSRQVPQAVSGTTVFVRITAGQSHSCGLTGTGVALCWGDNTHGQLGDGTTARRLGPTVVAGGLTFAYLKAGDLSTCGVTTAGVAYCWGDNEYGQIGNGQRTSVTTPTKVAFQR